MSEPTITLDLDRDDGLTYFFHKPTDLPTKGICKMKIPQSVYERYCKVEDDYFKMQNELEDHYLKIKEARKKGNPFV